MNRWIWLALVLPMLMAAPAGATEYVVQSWCPITGAQGMGRGESFEGARNVAYNACVANGGVPKCCAKHYRQISPAT